MSIIQIYFSIISEQMELLVPSRFKQAPSHCITTYLYILPVVMNLHKKVKFTVTRSFSRSHNVEKNNYNSALCLTGESRITQFIIPL